MSRLVIISNRLPVTINKKDGELFYYPSAGGLATGLSSMDKSIEQLWIGWPGGNIEDKKEKKEIKDQLANDGLVPVFLSEKDIELYYEGFSNKVVWPHFHYFTQFTNYNNHSYWSAYERVNNKFMEVLKEHLRDDDVVWVHDYQLMLLPALIRTFNPNTEIGFFLHIPFPSYEIFRTLPWREELLEGLLGADQIGFHTYDYMRHFLSAAYRIAGFEHNFGKINVGQRIVNVDVFPMGIDYEKYAFPERYLDGEHFENTISRLTSKGRKLILSIDRLDYTKGIPQRIKAFEKFIKKNPQYHGKVTLLLIVVPSRSKVDQYQELKNEVDTLVGKVDGQFRTFGWSPIQYFYRSFPFQELTAIYKAADIALITPLRDGMNLVAKEFVASKEVSKKGVLILSEMAGASNELTDALIVNPRDITDMEEALEKAMEMSLEEQAERLTKMQHRLKKYTVKHWAETFLTELSQMSVLKSSNEINELNEDSKFQLLSDYKNAKNRLILLDYDGTLVSFKPEPHLAKPDAEVLALLEGLRDSEANKLVIISGRDKDTLGDWLGHLDLEMSAEHGVWRFQKSNWELAHGITNSWKKDIRPVLEAMVERTPGSFIEEKDYSIAWHYRKIDKALGEKRIREFRDVLLYLTANLDLQVLEGNKVVEVKNSGVNKGNATLKWVNSSDWDFILAIGDDNTDEDIFKALPDFGYSIKVGRDKTAAKYSLFGVKKVRALLKELVEIKVT